MSKLSHFNNAGEAHMVDVSDKKATLREAVTEAFVELKPEVLDALPQNPKGNHLEAARFAGIMAAKETADLIPICHPLPLSFIDVETTIVYPADLLRTPGDIRIRETVLLSKSGGKSGDYRRA